MIDALTFVDFHPSMVNLIRDFSYGSASYQIELASWILNDSAEAIERGTKVWLYSNQAGQIVGYGSLGQSNWRFPDATSKRTPLVVIPAVAIREEFWGKPESSVKGERYSTQIIEHLLTEALAWPGALPAVGLYVHPDNLAAIKLYERFRFRLFHNSYVDPVTQVKYLGYVRALSRS